MRHSRQSGFSLLELMVAIAILGISLTALYQAVSGASRSARASERYVYATELARSLLALHQRVPNTGFSDSGETDSGFQWSVESIPFESPLPTIEYGLLQAITVEVAYEDGRTRRNIRLDSVVEGVQEQ